MNPIRATWLIRAHLILLVLLAVLPALGIILSFVLERREASLREGRLDCQRFADSLADKHQDSVFFTRHLLALLAADSCIQRQDVQDSTSLLKSIHAQNPQYASLSVVDGSGRMLSSALPFTEVNVADRTFFQDALRTRKFVAGECVISRTAGKPVLPFAAPVFDDRGMVRAVVVALFDPARFDQLLAKASLPAGSHVKLFDRKGICIFSTRDKGEIGKPDRGDLFNRMREAGGSGAFSAVNNQGDARIYVYHSFQLAGGGEPYLYLRVSFSESALLAASRNVLVRSLTLLFSATLLALLAAWLIGSYGIIYPLHRLVVAAQAMGRGDLTVRTGLAPAGNEINQLARGFDEMGQELEAREAERRRSNDELRQLNESLDSRVRERTGELEIARRAALSMMQDANQAKTRIEAVLAERQVLEMQTLKAKEAAESANRAKSLFLANMSHEIRTPMNAVLGYCQLLQHQKNLTPQQADWLRTINRSGAHLLELINDVLEMSKIEAGRTTLNPLAFDFHDLLRDLDAMFRVRTDSKHLRFQIVWTEPLPRYFLADQRKIRQVLINLLSNAVKFTEQGEISVRVCAGAAPAAGEVALEVEVEDTGCGIAREEWETVFNHFEQTASGRKKGEGVGLGMTISRSYACLLGGDLTLTSEVGRGSLFRFTFRARLVTEFPAGLAPASRQKVTAIAPAPGGEMWNLLVVDDSPTDRDLMNRMLSRVGFTVHEAKDGEEALRDLVVCPPRAILLGLHLPGMDGLEVARRIRGLPGGQALPIILLSTGIVADECLRAAAVNLFLQKPFSERDLLDGVHQVAGVSYLYEVDATAAPADLRLGPGDFNILSSEMRNSLSQAIECGDVSAVRNLIDTLAKTHSELARGLRGTVERYDYETLLNLLKA